MKITLKLYIIFILLISSSVYANPNYSGLLNIEKGDYISQLGSSNLAEVTKINFVKSADEDIVDVASHYRNLYISSNAPEFPGEFNTKYSSQTILPNTRTNQWFSRKLTL